MKNNDRKRLFFGAEVKAPWPKEFPEARLVKEASRHLTLAFLGNISFSDLNSHLSSFPKPPFDLGPSGICSELLFLPKYHPRVVAGHIEWIYEPDALNSFHKTLNLWLKQLNFQADEKELLSHVTLARAPFLENEWQNFFTSFPVYLSAIHLYESVGNLTYLPIWSYPLTLPFEEVEHTADIAFLIKGKEIKELHLNAQIALCFKFPAMTSYVTFDLATSLDDIIIDLNKIIARVDQEIGCSFKAVSFHGSIQKNANGLLEWEMIVDV